MSAAHTVGSISLLVGAATDVGRRRKLNEDSMLAEPPIYVVADGMGGYEAGDLASGAVVDAFKATIDGRGIADLDLIRESLDAADDGVADVADTTERGAGSTVAGAAIVDDEHGTHWIVFNVGDSRVYVHDRGVLKQVTVDHSLGQEMYQRGQITAEELANFPNRNVITRAIGATDASVDSWSMPIVDGQRLLLCSDGLTSEVPDSRIAARMRLGGDVQAVAEDLVAEANASGGRDNITVIIVEVVSGGLDEYPDEPVRGEHDVEVDDTTAPA